MKIHYKEGDYSLRYIQCVSATSDYNTPEFYRFCRNNCCDTCFLGKKRTISGFDEMNRVISLIGGTIMFLGDENEA